MLLCHKNKSVIRKYERLYLVSQKCKCNIKNATVCVEKCDQASLFVYDRFVLCAIPLTHQLAGSCAVVQAVCLSVGN